MLLGDRGSIGSPSATTAASTTAASASGAQLLLKGLGQLSKALGISLGLLNGTAQILHLGLQLLLGALVALLRLLFPHTGQGPLAPRAHRE